MGKVLRHLPRIKHLRGSWLHRRVGDRLLDPALWQPEREPMARGFAVGGFLSMLPIPFQSIPAAAIAIAGRMNVPTALVGCWVTNPVTAVFIWIVQLRIGYFLLGRGSPWVAFRDQTVWDVVKASPWPMLVGTMVTAPIAAAICYLLARVVFDLVTAAIHSSAKRRRARRIKKLR